MIQQLYPGDPVLHIAALLLGLLLDYVYPRHGGLLLRIHPVPVAFHAARRLIPPGSSTMRGVLGALAVVVYVMAPYAALLYVSWLAGWPVWVVVAGVVVKLSIPVRLLFDTVARTSTCLEAGDLACARSVVQGIVRRDTSRLGPGHTASAAIESLSESLVDGIISPMMWYIILGPLGALLQRVVNTLDGAVGFKTGGYLRPGRPSALADTVMNYIPARLAAMLTIIGALFIGSSPAEVLKAWRLYRSATESRNAGHPMSAFAGALGVRLEKVGSYTLGSGRLPGPGDVGRALALGYIVVLEMLILTISSIIVLL